MNLIMKVNNMMILNLMKMNQKITQNRFQNEKQRDIKMMKNHYQTQMNMKMKMFLSKKVKREITLKKAHESREITLVRHKSFKTTQNLKRF